MRNVAAKCFMLTELILSTMKLFESLVIMDWSNFQCYYC